MVAGHVRGVRPESRRLMLRVDIDRSIQARAVIDASGHRPALVTFPVGPPPAMQTAHGVIGAFRTPPAAPGAMTFMDLTRPDGVRGRASSSREERRSGPPSFLYAMDLGEGRWLAEETCLAARPPMPVSALAQGLELRLARRGAVLTSLDRTEHVAFPMGAALPHFEQPVIGFGAAAGMVHPATGFSVARSLRLARPVAQAVADAILAGGDVAHVARAGWSAVWSADALRQRALHQLGLRALMSLDQVQIQHFFAAFFSLPPREWCGYVSGAASAGELAGTMSHVLGKAPVMVKVALVRAAMSDPRLLAAALMRPPAAP